MADYKFSAVLRIRSERLINDSLKSSNSLGVKTTNATVAVNSVHFVVKP